MLLGYRSRARACARPHVPRRVRQRRALAGVACALPHVGQSAVIAGAGSGGAARGEEGAASALRRAAALASDLLGVRRPQHPCVGRTTLLPCRRASVGPARRRVRARVQAPLQRISAGAAPLPPCLPAHKAEKLERAAVTTRSGASTACSAASIARHMGSVPARTQPQARGGASNGRPPRAHAVTATASGPAGRSCAAAPARCRSAPAAVRLLLTSPSPLRASFPLPHPSPHHFPHPHPLRSSPSLPLRLLPVSRSLHDTPLDLAAPHARRYRARAALLCARAASSGTRLELPPRLLRLSNLPPLGRHQPDLCSLLHLHVPCSALLALLSAAPLLLLSAPADVLRHTPAARA
jgi:hypothetical protein